MKQGILAIFVLASGMSVVACSDNKSSEKYGAASASSGCLSNPTLPGCSLQSAALAQVPGSPEQASFLQALNKTGSPALGQVNSNGSTPAGGQTGIPVQSVSNDQLRAQAARVAAGLKADSENPLSDHYQLADETGRAIASIQAPVIAHVPQATPEPPSAMVGGGEASH